MYFSILFRLFTRLLKLREIQSKSRFVVNRFLLDVSFVFKIYKPKA